MLWWGKLFSLLSLFIAYFINYIPGVSIRGTLSSFIAKLYSCCFSVNNEPGPWLVAKSLIILWLLIYSSSAIYAYPFLEAFLSVTYSSSLTYFIFDKNYLVLIEFGSNIYWLIPNKSDIGLFSSSKFYDFVYYTP